MTGRLVDNPAVLAMLRLIVNLSLLADALAELRESQRRIHQARAARTAARLLRAAADARAATNPISPDTGASPLTGPATSRLISRAKARRRPPQSAPGSMR